ncbi:TnsA endonuclease N-terminal domain-containing protein [Thiohalomonas denitrificans]|uniref:TnsA endonuclease C terminal n=1 Tax=Thiohalomonas denitrificans TaxID=415747 RepID=A0A1G5QS19_9GAMM|nr:TnsA endonuclease N-terminal domain-containing protein [Thiohalomonas denitrificans]SCZ64684.1 TnsA endonuclease C terminal [Thiohalomonas denitrificans]
MPVRRIPKNYRHVTGMLGSSRSERKPFYESPLERDFFILLDFDPRVASFEEQPVAVHYQDDMGTWRRYTPDVLVLYKEEAHKRPLLFEIKPREVLRSEWKSLERRFRAAYQVAKARGWGFRTVTDREIRTPRLENIKFLRGYRDTPADEEACELMVQTVTSKQAITVQGLLDTLATDRWEQARLIPSVWHLTATGRLQVDMDIPLTMVSTLTSP